jgi:hypothetical protein
MKQGSKGSKLILSFAASAVALVSGCARSGSELPTPAPQIQNGITNDFVSKSKFTAIVSSDGKIAEFALSNPSSLPVTVVNSASSTMQVDTSGFQIPQISNAVLNFGNLKISDLMDNDLKVCGTSGHTRCGSAVIRIYTSGTAGPGLYNAADGYGAPITAALGAGPDLTVGLDAANSAVVQTYAIPNGKNVLRLSDFLVVPNYLIKSDFTNAGAGSYATKIVIEYGLIP